MADTLSTLSCKRLGERYEHIWKQEVMAKAGKDVQKIGKMLGTIGGKDGKV